MANLALKIGLLAPTKGGKTTLLATTLNEISSILTGNEFGAKYYAADVKTRDAIVRKLSEYKAILRLNDPFAVPSMPGTVDISDYSFALSVPTGHGGDPMRLTLNFKDFPGGWLGDTAIENEIGPFLREAQALVVPIASDFLLAWADTDGKADPASLEKNVAAQISLQADDILMILADWIVGRVKLGERPYVAFVPVRCEACFADNGGTVDESEKLFAAVQECFVKPLYGRLAEFARDFVKVEIHAIDTYGIVELLETKVISGQLESTFKRRTATESNGGHFASKGSFALLTRLLNYEMGEMARGLRMKQEELENKIRDRTFLKDVIFTLFPRLDESGKRLAKVMSTNDALVECIAKFKDMVPPDPVRQRVVLDQGETLAPPDGADADDGADIASGGES